MPYSSSSDKTREDDLQAIYDLLLAPQSHLLLLNGQGGIDKTSIAAQYFHRYRSEYRHVAWVLSDRNIANALLLLATPLGLRFDDNMDTDAASKPCSRPWPISANPASW